MKLVNKSTNALMHTIGLGTKDAKKYLLKVGENLDVPKEVAEKWLKIKGIEKVVDEADIQKAVQEALDKERQKVAKVKVAKTAKAKGNKKASK